MKRTVLIFVSSVMIFAAAGNVNAQETASSYTFVSTPDLFNFDIPNPWPGYESAVNWYLNRIKKQDPAYVLVAGDLINGHWWQEGPRAIEHLGAVYYGGWRKRMERHGLTYLPAIGDHELGDDPWTNEKKYNLIPKYEEVFVKYLDPPRNGPENRKGLAYYVKKGNALIVTVETFTRLNGQVQPTVYGKQLAWLKKVLKNQGSTVDFIVVQGHAPVFGPLKSSSSSQIMIKNGRKSSFWEVMVEHGVDLYLCGEHHALTVHRSDGIWQVVHGTSWGRKGHVQSYLIGNVGPDRLGVEIKTFPLKVTGDHMWNLHKSRGPRENVAIPAFVRKNGPETAGSLTIRKTADGKELVDWSGVFE